MNSDAPAVSIIIPVWNLWEMTLACLESLALHTDIQNIEVIVVDNGSTDSTATALLPTGQSLFGSRFQSIRHEENRGFAKACNAGARNAKAPLLFFLNNDTLLTANWLPPLQKTLESSPFLGMVGPLLLLPGTGRVQHCGIVFAPTLEVSHLYALFPGSHPLIRKGRTVQALTGAAFLLPKEVFFRCDQFHEGYINGFEDMDLCCRIRQHNLRLACVPESVIYHLTSQTPGRADHDGPNARLLNQRHPGGFVPDQHRMGAEDGFIPRLSAALELYLSLPPLLEQSLTTALSRSFNEDRCRARLEAQPLWEGGYTLLAQYLESQGQWADAVDTLSTQVHFFPHPNHALTLARAAAKAGESALARIATEAASNLVNSAKDMAALNLKAAALSKWSQEAGDVALHAILKQWQESQALSPSPYGFSAL